MKQYTVIEKITPAMAGKMLEHNKNNRQIRWNHVKRIATDIILGHWQVTHQGIAFDDKGNLIDGQHRLHAIIESCTPVEMSVTRNCKTSSFAILDQGIMRNASDITGWNRKVTDVLILAFRISESSFPTVSQMLLLKDSVLHSNAELLLDHCSTVKATMSTASVRLAACVQMSIHNDIEFVISQYRALIYESYNEMTPCAQSFNRKCKGKLISRQELFTRAMSVFDKTQKQNVSVRMTDKAMTDTNEIVRNIVRSYIEK